MKNFVLKYIFLFIIFCMMSCTDAEDLSNSGETYFMPDIDVYVVRSPGVERFIVPAGYTTHEYIMALFDGRNRDTVNGYLASMGVAFNHARVRIIFIQSPSLVDDTFSNLLALRTLSQQSSFIITDDTGGPNLGTFYQQAGPLKVYLAGTVTGVSYDGYDGIGWVGAKGCLVLSHAGRSVGEMSEIIAHELGHNFRLPHPFNAFGNPNPDSCSPAAMGTTNHIMDYTSNPEIFAPCERIVASTFAVYNNFPKMAWDMSSNLNNVILYEGDWSGTVTVNASMISLPPVTAAYEAD